MANGYGDSLDYLSSDTERKSGQDQYSRRVGLRQKAIQARRERARLAGESVGKLREQAAENQKAIRYGASRATAMGMQPGMGAGGGAIAAAGQVGRDAEMAGIAQRGQDMDKIMSAERAAQDEALGAAEYAAQQGDADSDFQEAIAEGQTEAEQAIQDAQGFWNDDEEGAYRKIRAMIARVRVKSPRAADQLEDYYLRGEGARRIEEN